jgi:hypothetical protein
MNLSRKVLETLGRIEMINPYLGTLIQQSFVTSEPDVYQSSPVTESLGNIWFDHPLVIAYRVYLPYDIIPKPQTVDNPIEAGQPGTCPVMHRNASLLQKPHALGAHTKTTGY